MADYYTTPELLEYQDKQKVKEPWRAAEQWYIQQTGAQEYHTPAWDAYQQYLGPVQIKSARTFRKDGRGEFVLWRDQHEAVSDADGWYVFINVISRERGIRVGTVQTRKPPGMAIIDWNLVRHRGDLKYQYRGSWSDMCDVIAGWEQAEPDPL